MNIQNQRYVFWFINVMLYFYFGFTNACILIYKVLISAIILNRSAFQINKTKL